MATQFDILRQQAEAAARNAANRAQGKLRRETSLVGQASRWAGKAMRQGEEVLREQAAGRGRRTSSRPRQTAAAPTPPPRPAPDGYVRRSPVQPLHVARDYRRRQVRRVVTILVVAAAVCVGLYLVGRLGLFGR